MKNVKEGNIDILKSLNEIAAIIKNLKMGIIGRFFYALLTFSKLGFLLFWSLQSWT